ncbi:F-box/LRR-repeat protein At3g48880-like [Phalaenopsis equestris]|uniref:F-box/LRR-repeat protein At3g48880-like n=1 Tax=Phalaenopsis equestris TaxID=78828 RepID=UPI0009E42124|nr:F-box/LRR-repeat protein At3g48880-like [Phalaenopsis equestris]
MDHLPTTTNWENIPLDCLCIIFSKLSLDDLTASIPFVSKSWYHASTHPILYQTLDFNLIDLNPSSSFSKIFSSQFSLPHFTSTGFLKLAMARSQGAAFEIRFSSLFPPSMEVLSLVSITCPRLKTLCLPHINFDDEVHFLNMINRWRDLEWLEMESKPSNLGELTKRIGFHCNRFYGLKIRGSIEMNDVSGIVNFLPKIGFLDLSGSKVGKEEVLAIVDGCRELKGLNLKGCVGFEVDSELKKRAEGIEVFEFEGCSVEDEFRNFRIQNEDLEFMFAYYDDCFELGMF